MKSLILNFFIVVCIVENYVEGNREIQLFKDYALELVNAATIPISRNVHLWKSGSQCYPVVKDENPLITFNLILSIMLIVEAQQKNNVSYLTLIRNADDVSEIQNQIPQETMIIMRRIVRVLETSTEDFRLVPLDEVSDRLHNHPLNPPYIAGLSERFNTDTTLESLARCHEVLLTIYFNEPFFVKLLRGFSIQRNLMSYRGTHQLNNVEQQFKPEFDTIVEEISGWPAVPDSDPDFHRNEFADFVSLLNERYQLLLEGKITGLKKQAIVFSSIFAFSFASYAMIQTAGGW